MVNINRHPLLKKAYEVCLSIEECGASIELTNAVVLAGELMDDINSFLDALPNIEGQDGKN